MIRSKINLVVDGRPFEGSLTGVGYYISEVLKAWMLECPELHVTIIARKTLKAELPSSIQIIIEPNKLFQKIKPIVWQRFFSARLIKECDCYWGTAVFLPVDLPTNIKTLVTVHDFNHLVVPETMAWGNRWAHKAWMRKDLKRADYIMANGKGTAHRVTKWLRRKCDLVINPPVRSTISPLVEPHLSQVLEKLEVRRPFFLAVGTHEPRKNLALLITAFLDLKKEGALNGVSLILAGQSGWRSEVLSALIENSAIFDVRSLGYVADEELSALYSGCHSFIFPSIYEGFGMPVREARTCGARVIASDLPEIREAANDIGIFIYPDREQIMTALRGSINSNVSIEVRGTTLKSIKVLNRHFLKLLMSLD